MELKGTQILIETLRREGVEILFGYPGGVIIDLYDDLLKHPEIRHILVRHEQGAVHLSLIHI